MPKFSFELPGIDPLLDKEILDDISLVISFPKGFGMPELGLDLFRPFVPEVVEGEEEE